MHTILDAISKHASDSGSNSALQVKNEAGWTKTTYADLNADIQNWASHFLTMHLEKGSVVFIILSHRVQIYALFLGAMRAGLVPSFLPFPTPKQDKLIYWNGHTEILQRVRPSCIVSYGDNVALLEALSRDWHCLVLDIDHTSPDMRFIHEIPDDLAPARSDSINFLQHSSGTTGLKKGVPLTTAQIFAQLESYKDAVNVDSSSRIVSWLPLYHDMGLISCFLLPLWCGSEIISFDAFEWLRRPDMMLDFIERFSGTHCWLPNFAFNHLVRTRDKHRTYNLSSLKIVSSCSEPAKPDTFQTFKHIFAEHGLHPHASQVCYAMAETVFAVTQTDAATTPRILCVDRDFLEQDGIVQPVDIGHERVAKFLSCGSAIKNADIKILTSSVRDVGEIHVTAPFLFDGYYLSNQESSPASAERWFSTGDLGFIFEQELYVCGRTKELLIVHGKNFFMHDIEEAVHAVKEIKPGRAVVFGTIDSASGGEQAVLLAESTVAPDEISLIREKVRKAVFDRLDLTLGVIEIVAVGEILKTTSGKVDRHQNKIKFERSQQKRLL